jgi:hypothetical protein
MKQYTKKQIEEKKETWKGKWELYKAGVEKFKQDPPIYRVHLMQGLMTKLTIYMIIFACIYAISVGFWIFALILFPVGVIGNYYTMKSHFIKYKPSVKQYEQAGILPSIEDDQSNLRTKWRIIEKQIGFFGVDIIFILFLGVLTFAYFGDFSFYKKILIVAESFIPLYFIYFGIIYELCALRYRK